MRRRLANAKAGLSRRLRKEKDALVVGRLFPSADHGGLLSYGSLGECLHIRRSPFPADIPVTDSETVASPVRGGSIQRCRWATPWASGAEKAGEDIGGVAPTAPHFQHRRDDGLRRLLRSLLLRRLRLRLRQLDQSRQTWIERPQLCLGDRCSLHELKY